MVLAIAFIRQLLISTRASMMMGYRLITKRA